MNILFLMDPLETINIHKDTTYALMHAAHQKGHDTYYLPKDGLHKATEHTYFTITKVTPTLNEKTPFTIEHTQKVDETFPDILFIRTDPPFDEQYLYHTWVLDSVKDSIAIINDPEGIRSTNEKLWATQFPSITPTTLITQSITELKAFLAKHQNIVVKPLNGYGGSGIFTINHQDKNASVILETLTQSEATPIIAQDYLEAAKKGDKRVLLLDAKPIGAINRIHSATDHRNNMFAGGTTESASITSQDQHIIDTLAPHLLKKGLRFVGIDIIGDHLIEVNVTSPTGIQEASHYQKEPLNDIIIQHIIDTL